MSLSSRRLIGGVVPLVLLLLALPCVADDETPGNKLYLMVTREKFTEAIRPLIEKRRAEGFEVVISLKPPAEAISALPRPPDLLLLIGDDQPGKEERSWYVPAKRMKRYRWRADRRRRFASDTAWGDLDGDLAPDIPVGRLPARTTAQLRRIVDKILEYERQPPSLDDLRLPIGTGDPEPDSARDGALWAALGDAATGVLLMTVNTNAPRWAQTWLLSADAKYPLRGWPPDQPALFSEQLRAGGFFAMLCGHGTANGFHFMHFEGKSIEYTAETASEFLATGKPGPPLVINAYNCGDFTRRDDCIAESLLRMRGGPVAVIASTAIADSLSGYLSGRSFLQASAERKTGRLGDFWFQTQQSLPKDSNLLIERLLRSTEGYMGEEPDLDKLRRDHRLMYAVLGDPAMRLRLPRRLHGKLRRREDGWHWEVKKPDGGTRLHVGFRPAGQRLPSVPADPTKQQLRDVLQAANETFAFQELPAPPADGAWKGVIDREGTLRLVAFTPKGLHVAALNLKIPR